MNGFLQALETSALAEALKTSFVAYPLVNALHIFAIGVLVASVLILDLRTLGGLRSLPAPPFIALMRRIAMASFVLAAASGFALFSVRASEYVGNPAFLLKLGLIAAAVLNFLLLARGGRADPAGAGVKAAAFLSMLLWPAVLVAGRFIGFLG